MEDFVWWWCIKYIPKSTGHWSGKISSSKCCSMDFVLAISMHQEIASSSEIVTCMWLCIWFTCVYLVNICTDNIWIWLIFSLVMTNKHSYGKWAIDIVMFPIDNMVMFHSFFVSLPEGNHSIAPLKNPNYMENHGSWLLTDPTNLKKSINYDRHEKTDIGSTKMIQQISGNWNKWY